MTLGLAAPAPGAGGGEDAGRPAAQGTTARSAGAASSGAHLLRAREARTAAKPTPAELGIDPAALAWERSGDAEGSIEVAFPVSPRWTRGDWVLLRVAGDTVGRVLVFDRNEWACFIDGARKGEFDDAADGEAGGSPR